MKLKLNKKIIFSLFSITGISGALVSLAVACKKEEVKTQEPQKVENNKSEPVEEKKEEETNSDSSLESETVDELEKLYNSASAYPNKQKVVQKIKEFIDSKIKNEKFKKSAKKGAAATLKLTLFKNNKDIEKGKEEESFRNFLTAIRKVPFVGKYFQE